MGVPMDWGMGVAVDWGMGVALDWGLLESVDWGLVASGDSRLYALVDWGLGAVDVLLSGGGSFCTSSQKCSVCEGDCDDDSQCKPGFLCFDRDGYTAVPGCNGQGVADYDYCYSPGHL